MKNQILTIAACVTALCGANAQTVIDITGSTAGRSAVHANILAVLNGESYAWAQDNNPPGEANPGVSKADAVIYKGTLGVGGPSVIIRTYWGGSVNGVRDVGDQIGQSFLLPTTTVTSNNYIASPTWASPSDPESKPEIGYSDVFATSTGYTVPVETSVAIIPFKFFRNAGSSSTIANMTNQLFRQIWGNGLGESSRVLFSGNLTDTGVIYPLGRNADSGTRITTHAESGLGIFNAAAQNTASYSGANGTISSIDFSGDSGFASGGSVAEALSCTYSGGDVIGYVGASDWSKVGSAVELPWNGVTYSPENLKSGKYTFWGYLHMNSIVLDAGVEQDFFDDLSAAIKATPGSGLEKVAGFMEVQRDGDGYPVYFVGPIAP